MYDSLYSVGVHFLIAIIVLDQHDMLTSAPCLHVGTKSQFQEEAGRTVHYPQGKSMSISYLKS